MSSLVALLIPFALAAAPAAASVAPDASTAASAPAAAPAPASLPDPSVDLKGYFRAIRQDRLEDLQVPLTVDARKQRAARREKTQRRVGPATSQLAPVAPSLFASARGVYADTFGIIRPVKGEAKGTFELLVAPDLFAALGDFVDQGLLSAKDAEAFNQRLRTEVGQALKKGSAGKKVAWSPAGLEALELLLIGNSGNKEYLRRADLLAVEVRVEKPCCEEPPVPNAYLRVRIEEGLPAKLDRFGRVDTDGFFALLAKSSPAAQKLRELPAGKSRRITRASKQPTYFDESSLDLDLDGVPDVASSHEFDCIDDSCEAIYLNAAGSWEMIHLEDELICAGGC